MSDNAPGLWVGWCEEAQCGFQFEKQTTHDEAFRLLELHGMWNEHVHQMLC